MAPDELAAQVKAWRGKIISAADAAKMFGIPVRTWQHMEQGRGFPYPRLLLVALNATKPSEGNNGKAP